MQVLYFICPITALLLTYILIPLIRKKAFHLLLVDNPNQRKVHHSSIPLVGGVSIFIATSLTLLLAMPFEYEILRFKNVFMATFILLLMGVIDDRFDLRASIKLAIQLIIAHFVFEQGVRIESLYGIMGVYDLAPWIQYVLTMAVIAGVVNAFNLMDGIDGLAAGMAILGFGSFSVLSFYSGEKIMTLIFLTIIGSLIAFLRFNLSKNRKTFMGDAGSIVLGFILVVSGISLIQSSQNSQNHTWITLVAVAVMFVPVMDALRVFRRRVKSGKSPFHADKTHLHHLVLSAGLPHKTATLAILVMITFLMVIAYLSFNFVGLTFSIISMLLVFYFVTSLLVFNNKLKQWKERIQAMENNKQLNNHLK